jgi:transposase, IS5 family
MDSDGRWTLKRGRRRPLDPSKPHEPTRTELVIPVVGYKNQLGIDRRDGFICSFILTDAASHDGHQLGWLLDPHNTPSSVWADAAYRSAANLSLLARCGLAPQFQRAKPRGRPMPPHLARGNASRPRVRVAVEHVFAAQRARSGHPLDRPRPVQGQAGARRPGHQHAPSRLVGTRPVLA